MYGAPKNLIGANRQTNIISFFAILRNFKTFVLRFFKQWILFWGFQAKILLKATYSLSVEYKLYQKNLSAKELSVDKRFEILKNNSKI